MASTRQWMKFFLEAGIPSENAAQYAVTFETNRMGLDMLLDLDKEYLRDLNITALGDIIGILKHAKTVHSRAAAELVMKSDPVSDSPTVQEKVKTSKEKSPSRSKREVISVKEEPKLREVASRLELEVKQQRDSSSGRLTESPRSLSVAEEPKVKSVFSRLGEQEEESEAEVKYTPSTLLRLEVVKQGDQQGVRRSGDQQEGGGKKAGEKQQEVGPWRTSSSSIFQRLGEQKPEVAGVSMVGDQVASVSSTSEGVEGGLKEAGKGILKQRGGAGMSGIQRSKSANIISLKKSDTKKEKKRISFGENEYKTMAPKEDIRNRLGYHSPPPPEISEPVLQTQIKKIAIGGGKFEMRKMMKVVNSDTKTSTELGKIVPKPMEPDGTLQEAAQMKNLTIAVKNNVSTEVSKPKNNTTVSATNQSNMIEKPKDNQQPKRKRLVKYITMPDGRVVKEYISYDDPILKTHPIKKRRSEESTSPAQAPKTPVEEQKPEVMINKNTMATNFQVVRKSRSPEGRQQAAGVGVTLAQKARMARSRAEESSFKTLANRASENSFVTLANRASLVKKRSLSPGEEVDRMTGDNRKSVARMDERKKSSLTERLGGGASGVERRAASEERRRSLSRSGSESRGERGGSYRSSRERSPVRNRLGLSGDKKIFSRLGPKD